MVINDVDGANEHLKNTYKLERQLAVGATIEIGY